MHTSKTVTTQFASTVFQVMILGVALAILATIGYVNQEMRLLQQTYPVGTLLLNMWNNIPIIGENVTMLVIPCRNNIKYDKAINEQGEKAQSTLQTNL